jgi:hypothetical protein
MPPTWGRSDGRREPPGRDTLPGQRSVPSRLRLAERSGLRGAPRPEGARKVILRERLVSRAYSPTCVGKIAAGVAGDIPSTRQLRSAHRRGSGPVQAVRLTGRGAGSTPAIVRESRRPNKGLGLCDGREPFLVREPRHPSARTTAGRTDRRGGGIEGPSRRYTPESLPRPAGNACGGLTMARVQLPHAPDADRLGQWRPSRSRSGPLSISSSGWCVR